MADKPECVTCLSAWEHLEIFKSIHPNVNSIGQSLAEETYDLIRSGLVRVIIAELDKLKGLDCSNCPFGWGRKITYLSELREITGR